MIVLDTHAWIFWRADPERLSAGAARAIDEADRVGISSISVSGASMTSGLCGSMATLVVGSTIETIVEY